jgi:hypothetical protein
MIVNNIDIVGNIISIPHFFTFISPYSMNFSPLYSTDIGKYYFKVVLYDGYHYTLNYFELEIINTPPYFVENGPKDL